MNFSCLGADARSACLPTDIILVAGPSAAGKTTFIQHLTTGRLPASLQAVLPDDLEKWAKLEGNICVKRGASVASVLPKISHGAGLILHYDIVLIHRYGMRSYHDDPVFVLLSGAQTLVIVNLRPPSAILKSQFEARQLHQARDKGWLKNAWRRIVRKPLRPLRFRLRGKNASKTADIYRSMDRVAHSYREWDDFAASLLRTTPSNRMIDVERRTGDAGETFSLVEGDRHSLLIQGAGR